MAPTLSEAGFARFQFSEEIQNSYHMTVQSTDDILILTREPKNLKRQKSQNKFLISATTKRKPHYDCTQI